jgi:hypothetical protein
MKFNKELAKKILIWTFAVLICGYVAWDVSLKVVNYFRMQGYEYAIVEIVNQAENEDCGYFPIFIGDKEINLINVECLQSSEEEINN